MFTLVSDRNKFFRVRRNVGKADIENALSFPVDGEIYSGRIIVVEEEMAVYRVKPTETYSAIAAKTGIPEEELKRINNHKPLYPSCKLFVPCKK